MQHSRNRRCLGILARSLLAIVPLVAQSPAPETDATRQLHRWLAVFNEGDRREWQAMLDAFVMPRPPQYVDANLAFRDQTGGLDLIRLEESSPTRAVALVKERDAEATGARITITIESSPPYRILSLDITPGAQLPFTAPRLSETELVAALRTELERRAATDRFAGAVLVAKNGSVLFEGAYGLADRERRVVNRVETRFRNGSMNKMFTAVAVLTLVQAGKVELDAPIRAYLPDFPNASLASSVTVRQLLTHTGGTGDIFGPEYAANRPILRTHQDYVRLFGSRDPQFAPGSRWQYSNFGYIVLGRLIEQVSGQSYYDYVREHVYTPAGLTSTGSEPEDVRVPDRGIGYTRRPGQADVAPNSDFLPYRGTAAGGGYSTVGDLLRFANALTSHRLVTERFTALLLTGTVEGLGGTYGMGFVERTIGGMRSVGHGGNAPGMDGYLDIFPASGYVVVVLANLDPPAARRVHEFIVHRLPAQ